jgi:hypothetical protein
MNGGAPNRSRFFDAQLNHFKVILRDVEPRITEGRDLAILRIHPCQARAFSQVASMAGQCEIAGFIGASVLLGNNVLDVMGEGTILLPSPGAQYPGLNRLHVRLRSEQM